MVRGIQMLRGFSGERSPASAEEVAVSAVHWPPPPPAFDLIVLQKTINTSPRCWAQVDGGTDGEAHSSPFPDTLLLRRTNTSSQIVLKCVITRIIFSPLFWGPEPRVIFSLQPLLLPPPLDTEQLGQVTSPSGGLRLRLNIYICSCGSCCWHIKSESGIRIKGWAPEHTHLQSELQTTNLLTLKSERSWLENLSTLSSLPPTANFAHFFTGSLIV